MSFGDLHGLIEIIGFDEVQCSYSTTVVCSVVSELIALVGENAGFETVRPDVLERPVSRCFGSVFQFLFGKFSAFAEDQDKCCFHAFSFEYLKTDF
jgi:hypothetical protein